MHRAMLAGCWTGNGANTRNKPLELQVRDLLGNIVTPRSLGVIVPDFTEWALPHKGAAGQAPCMQPPPSPPPPPPAVLER